MRHVRDFCKWPNADIEIFLNIRPLNEVKRT